MIELLPLSLGPISTVNGRKGTSMSRRALKLRTCSVSIILPRISWLGL